MTRGDSIEELRKDPELDDMNEADKKFALGLAASGVAWPYNLVIMVTQSRYKYKHGRSKQQFAEDVLEMLDTVPKYQAFVLRSIYQQGASPSSLQSVFSANEEAIQKIRDKALANLRTDSKLYYILKGKPVTIGDRGDNLQSTMSLDELYNVVTKVIDKEKHSQDLSRITKLKGKDADRIEQDKKNAEMLMGKTGHGALQGFTSSSMFTDN